MIKVSVLLATKNGEKYIENAINSILKQTFSDFELVVCDDGSTDKTLKIVHDFMQSDSRIKLINNSGSGLSAALNCGLRSCKGKYVARMDDDDFSLKDRLLEQYRFLEGHPQISLVGSNINLFDDKGKYGTRLLPKEPDKNSVWRGSTFVHPAVMFRKSDIESIGGYEDSKDTLRIEDYDCWCRLYSCGFKGVNVQQPLLEYREDIQSFKKRDISRRIRLVRCMNKWRKVLNIPTYGVVFEFLEFMKIVVPERLIRYYHRIKYGMRKNNG